MIELTQRAEKALADAAAWRLMGLLLERPRLGWREEIRALAEEVADPRLSQAVAAAADASEGVYLRFLGPGGLVSPREVTYRPHQDPASMLADLNRYYEAFGYAPTTEDPVDHLAVETGFAGFLKLKLAYAQANGEKEAETVTAEALASFLKKHLRGFAEPFAQRLTLFGAPYLSAAAEALVERIG